MAEKRVNSEVLMRIGQLIKEKRTDELMYENLKAFYGISDTEKSCQELEKQYENEKYNEMNRPLQYFRENIEDIRSNFERYLDVYALLKDEKSKAVYAYMIAAKFFMDVDYIGLAYDSEKPYFSRNIFSFFREVYVDCGGYDGDTALEFIERNENFEQVYVFEGIEKLAALCRSRLRKFVDSGQVQIFQNAVYDKKCVLRIAPGNMTGDSKIEDNGTLKTAAVTLDEMISGRVTLIKMDIEGSEKEALQGAKRLIQEYTPKMAICIYHLKDDFWKIPELILSINKNYDFVVRQHDPVSFSETVLYCIPKYMEAPDGESVTLSKVEKDFVDYYKNNAWFLKQLRIRNFKMEEMQGETERLKAWSEELLNEKSFLEGKVKSSAEEVRQLKDWSKELEQGQEWLKKQTDQLKEENERLHNWSQEQEETKGWLTQQSNNLKTENEKLHSWSQEQERTKRWLEGQIEDLKRENENQQSRLQQKELEYRQMEQRTGALKVENEKLHNRSAEQDLELKKLADEKNSLKVRIEDLWDYILKRRCNEKKAFQNIVSMGYNCEVSYRIRDRFGKVNSTVFSWCYVENRDDFLVSLDHLEYLADCDKRLRSNGMFQCGDMGILLHTKVNRSELFLESGEADAQKVHEAISEMSERYRYLVKKLEKMFHNPRERTLYVLKMQPWEEDIEKNRKFLEDLYTKLDMLCNDNFAILIVLEKNLLNLKLASMNKPNLYFRFVENYANDMDTEKSGDIEGWHRIFDEFELIPKKRLIKYSWKDKK